MTKDLPPIFETVIQNTSALVEMKCLLEHITKANVDGRLTGQIEFLNQTIQETEAELDVHKNAAIAYLEPVRTANNRAWLILQMRYLCGFTSREIADILHLSEDAVKATTYRWLRKLANR